MDAQLSQLLTTEEVAGLLKVDLRTLYRMIKEERIPAIKVGGLWRFRQGDVLEWLRSRETSVLLKQVLVVDDNEDVREIIAQLLWSEGFINVGVAGHGEAALAELQRTDYDLMILDLRMPGMDGLELLKRAREVRPGLKTIIVTAYPSMESAMDAANLGVNGYLSKPFVKDELVAQVRHALRWGGIAASS